MKFFQEAQLNITNKKKISSIHKQISNGFIRIVDLLVMR